MISTKEKIIKSIKKGLKEIELMESGKLKGQDFGEMMMALKSERNKHGGAGRGQGRKPAGYTTRIWVTNDEKEMIKARRKAEKKTEH